MEYTEDINDGSEFYAKIRTQLEAGQDIGRDLLVFSEETARVVIEEGFAAPLDYALIPNAVNLLPRLRESAFDPGRRYTMPWQSGFTGIGWNTPLLKERLGVDAITSFEQFFDERLAGRVAVLSETMDTMGLMLAWQGFDPSAFTDAQFDEALAVLQGYVDDGTIRQVAGNDYISGLDSGDLVAAIGWSGDVAALGDPYRFVIPESGGTLWTDNMMVPALAAHKRNAELAMNYYYDPVVAAEVAAYVQYISPVKGAQEAMKEIDPSLVDNQWIFPDEETLSQAYIFMPLTEEKDVEYQRAFQKAIGG